MLKIKNHGELICVIKPCAPLKGNVIRELEKTTARILREGRVCIVLDLSRISRVDSSGLGCLLRLCKAAFDAGGGVNLSDVREQIQVMMELVRLNEIMAIYPDRWQAMEDFQYRFEVPLAV